MLVLTRRKNETLRIGNVTVTVAEIKGRHAVRLAVDAPRDVVILRGELVGRKDKKNDPTNL